MIIALLITLVAGISIIIGALVGRCAEDSEKFERFSIALALGALGALLLFHLGPEIIHHAEDTSWLMQLLFIVAGFVLLKVLDIFVPDHEDTQENHDAENAEHIGFIAAIALVLHNIIEGMTVYNMSLVEPRQGLVMAIGIALHNIPLGIMIYSTLDGHHRMKKLMVLLTVTFSTLFGGILMVLVSGLITGAIVASLIAVATGMVIYIVFLELVPHVYHTRPLSPYMIAVAIGFVVVLFSSLGGGHAHIH